jgi:uncharacterized protein (DUF983 family)
LIEAEYEFVERSHNKFLQMAKDFLAVCPECESNKVFSRKRKIPKYRCDACGNEFDDPKSNIFHKTQKQKDDFGRRYSNPDE